MTKLTFKELNDVKKILNRIDIRARAALFSFFITHLNNDPNKNIKNAMHKVAFWHPNKVEGEKKNQLLDVIDNVLDPYMPSEERELLKNEILNKCSKLQYLYFKLEENSDLMKEEFRAVKDHLDINIFKSANSLLNMHLDKTPKVTPTRQPPLKPSKPEVIPKTFADLKEALKDFKFNFFDSAVKEAYKEELNKDHYHVGDFIIRPSIQDDPQNRSDPNQIGFTITVVKKMDNLLNKTLEHVRLNYDFSSRKIKAENGSGELLPSELVMRLSEALKVPMRNKDDTLKVPMKNKQQNSLFLESLQESFSQDPSNRFYFLPEPPSERSVNKNIIKFQVLMSAKNDPKQIDHSFPAHTMAYNKNENAFYDLEIDKSMLLPFDNLKQHLLIEAKLANSPYEKEQIKQFLERATRILAIGKEQPKQTHFHIFKKQPDVDDKKRALNELKTYINTVSNQVKNKYIDFNQFKKTLLTLVKEVEIASKKAQGLSPLKSKHAKEAHKVAKEIESPKSFKL